MTRVFMGTKASASRQTGRKSHGRGTSKAGRKRTGQAKARALSYWEGARGPEFTRDRQEETNSWVTNRNKMTKRQICKHSYPPADPSVWARRPVLLA